MNLYEYLVEKYGYNEPIISNREELFMIQTITNINNTINGFVWGLPMMVLILGVCIVIAGYGFLLSAKYEGMTVAPNYGVLWVLPVNLILSYLALRAIGKDEALVRSLDRLR